MADRPAMEAPTAWSVLGAYALAFVAVLAFSIVAADVVRVLFPDLPERDLWTGLPMLVAGGVASACALLVTLLIVCRPFEPARLRLRPGRETGFDLAVVVAGTIALGQALDSATALAGLADRGALAAIREALEGAAGSGLFAAVAVIGVMAGAAEEAFFRGYMQTTLAARWRPAIAVAVTSLAFGLMHLEWIHSALAVALGLWLGFVTERLGSALPAATAHVANNVLFTLLTATTRGLAGLWPNVLLGGLGVAVFCAALLWLVRRR